MDAALLTDEDRPTWGRGVLASYVGMTPQVTRDGDDGSVSITRLSIPIQIAGVLMLGFMSALGSFFALSGGMRDQQSQIRADQSVIITKITDYQVLADERNKALVDKVDKLEREQRMQQEYINRLFAQVSGLTKGK